MDIAETVRHRVREVRDRRGWKQRDLVAELAKVGLKLDPASLARIETGKRAVKVNELVALAAALEVSPMQLLLPSVGSTEVVLTPEVTVSTRDARVWFRAFAPLPGQSDETMRAERGDDEGPAAPELMADVERRLANVIQTLDEMQEGQR